MNWKLVKYGTRVANELGATRCLPFAVTSMTVRPTLIDNPDCERRGGSDPRCSDCRARTCDGCTVKEVECRAS